MTAKSFIIRFADAAIHPEKMDEDDPCPVRRVIGTVEMKQLLPLFYEGALGPDPRSARRNRVIEDILNTLHTTPELFANKSKGILLGTSNFESLQRNRFRVSFDDPEVEGTLDGGHNMLAIGLFMIKGLLEDKEWRRIKSWDDLMEIWPDYERALERKKDEFSTLVPLELLIPAHNDAETVDSFRSALIDICAARNNNAQLPTEAAANMKGFYEEIRAQVPEDLAARVEWKPNTWEAEDEKRPVKVRDLVALAWIPLNLLSHHKALPIPVKVSPQNIYRNKGECSKLFDHLMAHPEVTRKGEAGRHELIHEGVKSAFRVAANLPELYDLVYEEFPDAYNEDNKRFRRNPIVKLYDPEGRRAAIENNKDLTGFTATHPITPFMRRPVKGKGSSKPCSYPEGLIVPLVYGLQGLMEVVNGEVRWAVDDPQAFVCECLPSIAAQYQLVLEMQQTARGGWDPQKIAKIEASHTFAVAQFRAALHAALVA